MSFLKTFFKGLLITLFIPFYWIYSIIWFLFFRGQLKDYPRVKKDATAKHLILAAISIFTFVVFANETTTTPAIETNKNIAQLES